MVSRNGDTLLTGYFLSHIQICLIIFTYKNLLNNKNKFWRKKHIVTDSWRRLHKFYCFAKKKEVNLQNHLGDPFNIWWRPPMLVIGGCLAPSTQGVLARLSFNWPTPWPSEQCWDWTGKKVKILGKCFSGGVFNLWANSLIMWHMCLCFQTSEWQSVMHCLHCILMTLVQYESLTIDVLSNAK